MNEKVIAIYCICDEIVKSLSLTDDPQYKLTVIAIDENDLRFASI